MTMRVSGGTRRTRNDRVLHGLRGAGPRERIQLEADHVRRDGAQQRQAGDAGDAHGHRDHEDPAAERCPSHAAPGEPGEVPRASVMTREEQRAAMASALPRCTRSS